MFEINDLREGFRNDGDYASNASPTDSAQTGAYPLTAREARKLAKLQRKVGAWWGSVPPDARRRVFLGAQVAAGVGAPIRTLGAVLRSLGWTRQQRRIAGEQVGVWLPPGTPVFKRPPGRPPGYAYHFTEDDLS